MRCVRCDEMAFLAPISFFIFLYLTSVFFLFDGAFASSSITFNLPYGQRKCFSEELRAASQCRGSIHVASGKGEMSLDLFVTDRHGTVFFHKTNVNSLKFSFQTADRDMNVMDTYRFCVVNQVHPHAVHAANVARKVTLEIDVVSKHQDAALARLAKQDHADQLYSDLLSASQQVDSVINALDELRKREQQLTDLNQGTSTTILRVSILACVLTVATGLVNFFALKNFFKRKKIA